MDSKILKCEKCGKPLKQSGPYIHNKPQGALSHKGPIETNFWCTNENCKNYEKVIKVYD